MKASKSIKRISFLVLLLTLSIFFLPSVRAVGQVPQECVLPTTNNPKGARYCNSKCQSKNCIAYCPAYSGYAKIKIPFDMKNLVVKFKGGTFPVYLTIKGTSIQNYEISCPGKKICYKQIKDTKGTKFKKGDILEIRIKDREGYAIGFRSPDKNLNCGENNICSEVGGKYGLLNIRDIVTPPLKTYRIVSKQCYGDSPIGDSDFDFNDYALVIFGEPIKVEPQEEPECIKLENTKISGGVEKLTTKFTCKVKNADKCKLILGDGNTYSKTINSEGTCTSTHTYTKPGTYSAICYAVDTQKNKEVTNDSCKNTLTVKEKPPIEDTAGGFTIPILISLITSAGIGFYVVKRLALSKTE